MDPLEEAYYRAEEWFGTPIRVSLKTSDLALAWVNVFHATGQSEDRPRLYRTIALEFFPHGVQLVATDGHLLLRTFVSDGSWGEHVGYDRWPDLLSRPIRAVTVMDREGFGIGFMKTVLKTAQQQDDAGEMLELSLTRHVDADQPDLGEDLSAWRLTIRSCGQRFDLKLHDEAYPNWRALNIGTSWAERVDGMTLAPWVFRTLGKLKGPTAFELDFQGDDRAIFLSTRGVHIKGLVMPMRRAKEKARKPAPDAEQGDIEDEVPNDAAEELAGFPPTVDPDTGEDLTETAAMPAEEQPFPSTQRLDFGEPGEGEQEPEPEPES